jgi:hypothetical protein
LSQVTIAGSPWSKNSDAPVSIVAIWGHLRCVLIRDEADREPSPLG